MLTKQAIDALRYYLKGDGRVPPYPVVRALIEGGYLSPAGVITEKGKQEILLDTTEK